MAEDAKRQVPPGTDEPSGKSPLDTTASSREDGGSNSKFGNASPDRNQGNDGPAASGDAREANGSATSSAGSRSTDPRSDNRNYSRFDVGSDDSPGDTADQPSTSFTLIDSETVSRIDRLFEEPPQLEVYRKERTEQQLFKPRSRIIVLCGDPRSGRFSAATWLGIQCHGGKATPPFWIVQSNISWLDYLLRRLSDSQRSTMVPGGVLIVQDGIAKGDLLNRFSEERLQILSDKLEKRDPSRTTFLIVTASRDVFEQVKDCKAVDAIDLHTSDAEIRKRFIRNVIKKYIAFHRQDQETRGFGLEFSEDMQAVLTRIADGGAVAESGQAFESGHEMVTRLEYAPQVDLVFNRLISGKNPENEEECRNLLSGYVREVVRSSRADLREWFSRLSLNRKLYAMLAALFAGIERAQLDSLYETVVSQLRNQQVGVYDFRRENSEDLLEALRLRSDDSGKVEFWDFRHFAEVRRQLANYHQLLFAALPIVCDVVAHFPQARHRNLRDRFGCGIGRILVHRWPLLRQRLQTMAGESVDCDHDGIGIADVAGFALREIIRQGGEDPDLNRLGYVVALLRNWCEEGDSDSRCLPSLRAAIFAISVCYAPLAALARNDSAGQAVASTHLEEVNNENTSVESDTDSSPAAAKLPPLFALHAIERALASATTRLELVFRTIEESDAEGKRLIVECCKCLIDALVGIFQDEPERATAILRKWIAREASEHLVGSDTNASSTTTNALDRPIETTHGVDGVDYSSSRDSFGDDQEVDSTGDSKRAVVDAAMHSMLLCTFGIQAAERLFKMFENADDMEERYHKPLLSLIQPVLSHGDFENPLTADADDSRQETDSIIEGRVMGVMMRSIRSWLSNPKWEQRVFEQLLRALNRSRFGARRRLTRNLTMDWLFDVSPVVRRVAETLLARAQIIDGVPVETPDGRSGLILVDVSTAGLWDNAARLSTQRLYRILKAWTNVVVLPLGDRSHRDNAITSVDPWAFNWSRARPRLIAPILEERQPSDFHYVLVLSWGVIHDLLDVIDLEPQWRRLIRINRGPNAVDRLLQHLCLGLLMGSKSGNDQDREKFLSAGEMRFILEAVRLLVGRELAGRSAEEWRSGLIAYMPVGNIADPGALQRYLRTLSTTLDQLPAENVSCDTARMIGCGIQWLAAWHMPSATALCREWMNAKDDDPQPPLGASFASMLLELALQRPLPVIVSRKEDAANNDETASQDVEGGARRAFVPRVKSGFAVRGSPRPGSEDSAAVDTTLTATFQGTEEMSAILRPTLAAYSALTELGPAFARSGYWHGAQSLVQWACKWSCMPEWRDHFLGGRNGGELHAMLTASPVVWRDRWLGLLKRIEEGKMVESSSLPLVASLKRRLLDGPRRFLTPPRADMRYLVTVFDFDEKGSAPGIFARTIEKLAREVRKVSKRRRVGKPIEFVAFRMGCKVPAHAVGELPIAIRLEPPSLPAPPPLIVPLLESLEDFPVAAVLLLSDRKPKDGDELPDRWRRKMLVHTRKEGEFGADDGWDVQIEKRDEPKIFADRIIRRLMPIVWGEDVQ